MTARETILLMVKHSDGIDYNELLSRTTSNYSNINSARAALSRSLKDLNALGLIEKEKQKIFITKAGEELLNKNMKNKLVLKLNESVLFDQQAKNVSQIVKNLATTIQRSEEDKDLLNVARNSVSFHVSDLEKIFKEVEDKKKKFEIVSSALENHIEKLKKLNFRDSFKFNWSKEAKEKILEIAKKTKQKEIFFESNSETLLNIIAENLEGKKKGDDVFFPKNKLKELLQDIESEFERNDKLVISIFVEDLKIKIEESVVEFSGPFKKIKKFKN